MLREKAAAEAKRGGRHSSGGAAAAVSTAAVEARHAQPFSLCGSSVARELQVGRAARGVVGWVRGRHKIWTYGRRRGAALGFGPQRGLFGLWVGDSMKEGNIRTIKR